MGNVVYLAHKENPPEPGDQNGAPDNSSAPRPERTFKNISLAVLPFAGLVCSGFGALTGNVPLAIAGAALYLSAGAKADGITLRNINEDLLKNPAVRNGLLISAAMIVAAARMADRQQTAARMQVLPELAPDASVYVPNAPPVSARKYYCPDDEHGWIEVPSGKKLNCG